MRRCAAVVLVAAVCGAGLPAAGRCTPHPAQQESPTQSSPQEPLPQEPSPQDRSTREAALAGVDKALAFFVATQHADGSWGTKSCDTTLEMVFAVETHYAWAVAAHSLATMALLRAPETPERRQALDKAVGWLVNCRMTQRGSNWDNDAVWGWLYGTVASVAVAQDPRFQTDQWRGPVHARGREFVGWLAKNQEPLGGFGYYDDPPWTRRPKWGTSFSTAAVVPALGAAMDLGWLDDPAVRDRAADYVRRCRLPNGAYSYDLTPVPRISGGEHINQVKGSLGRIQACHWALRAAGDVSVTDARLRTGIEQFFEHHRFLHIARMRPIPHEAYYANAGYFFYFGHFYCALAIEMLPAGEREAWRGKLRQKVLETQRKDGTYCDFLDSSYMIVSSTAYATLALLAGV